MACGSLTATGRPSSPRAGSKRMSFATFLAASSKSGLAYRTTSPGSTTPSAPMWIMSTTLPSLPALRSALG